MLHHRFWAAASLLWAGLILYSSTNHAERTFDNFLTWIEAVFTKVDTQAPDALPPDRFWHKKGMHLGMFFGFAFLLSRTAADARRRARYPIILAAGVLLGIVSELVQFSYPGREPVLRDVLINAAGTALGALVFVRRDSASTPECVR